MRKLSSIGQDGPGVDGCYGEACYSINIYGERNDSPEQRIKLHQAGDHSVLRQLATKSSNLTVHTTTKLEIFLEFCMQ